MNTLFYLVIVVYNTLLNSLGLKILNLIIMLGYWVVAYVFILCEEFVYIPSSPVFSWLKICLSSLLILCNFVFKYKTNKFNILVYT